MKKLPVGFASPLILLSVGLIVGIGITFAYFQFKSKPSHQNQPSLIPQSTPADLSSEALAKDETANWKTYTGSGYTFKYPASFEDKSGVLTYFSSTVKTGPGGGVAYLESGTSNTTLNDTLKSTTGIKKQENIILNGIQSVRATGYTGIAGAVYFNRVLIERDNKTFLITLSTPDQDVIGEVLPIFNQILSTFQFLE